MPDPTRLLAWASMLAGCVRGALGWTSQRTGLPVILIAAIALVASRRMFKSSLRFAIEVALAGALLLVATRLGLLRW